MGTPWWQIILFMNAIPAPNALLILQTMYIFPKPYQSTTLASKIVIFYLLIRVDSIVWKWGKNTNWRMRESSPRPSSATKQWSHLHSRTSTAILVCSGPAQPDWHRTIPVYTSSLLINPHYIPSEASCKPLVTIYLSTYQYTTLCYTFLFNDNLLSSQPTIR